MLNLFVCLDFGTRNVTNKGRGGGEKPDRRYLAQILLYFVGRKINGLLLRIQSGNG